MKQLYGESDMLYLVLNATVFSLCVLSNGDQVHSFIASVDALQTPTWTHIGIKVEHSGSRENKILLEVTSCESRSSYLLRVRFKDTAPLPICVSRGPECTHRP